MWKFLNSVHKAFRHHILRPRPSAGAFVEEEKSEAGSDGIDTENVSSAHLCPYVALRQRVKKPQILSSGNVDNSSGHHGAKPGASGPVLTFGSKERWLSHDFSDPSCPRAVQHGGRGDYWQQCHRDFWSLVRSSSCRISEALSTGSLLFWGGDSNRKRQRSRLLYEILFALPREQQTALGVTSEPVGASGETSSHTAAAGVTAGNTATTAAAATAGDEKQTTAEEKLDSVFAEFHLMCQDYAALNESLQGLSAWEDGNIKSGVEHLRKAANLGLPSACFNMGLCYETGTGVDMDKLKAENYYKKAVDSGHSMAMYNLGLMYCQGRLDTKLPEDEMERCGLELMEKAAKLGLVEAQAYMGFYFMYQEEDLEQAIHYFTAAAKQKHGEAQYLLALCYEQGWGVPVNECRAAQLFAQAAAEGHLLAMCCLAEYNEKGMGGMPEDKLSAKDLYTKAAQLGSLEAKQRLNEILAQEELDFWKKKVLSFQELYKVHHCQTREKSSLPSHPLSPSSSSPNLTNSRNSFFSDEIADRKSKKDFKLKVSFDPGGKGLGKINFTLGDSSDSLHEDVEVAEKSADISSDSCFSGSGDEAPFSVHSFHKSAADEAPHSFHKSSTLPNLALLY